jgi:ATP-dependent DNA helicase RecG
MGIRPRKDLPVKKRLNREAAELLRRAIQLSDDEVRTAWCWFDLASVLDWLRAPKSEVEAAFLKSRSLRPEESLFKDKYESWKRKTGKKGTAQKPRNK